MSGSCPEVSRAIRLPATISMAHIDKAAHAAYQRKWRAENKSKVSQYAKNWQTANPDSYNIYNKNRKITCAEWYKSYKQTLSCKYCGICDWRVLQFHHRDPEEKEFAVSARASAGTTSISRIQKEIEKCDVLCANCHCIVTWKQREVKKKSCQHPLE